jgi:hypothetical protein
MGKEKVDIFKSIQNNPECAEQMINNIKSLVATMVRHVERKPLQIHSLYSSYQGHIKISSTAYAVVTLHGSIGRPPVWRVGNPLSLYIVSRESIFRLPGNHSVNQSRVEYT